MVDANVDGQRQSDLAKLPLYSGDAKDQFTAEQWVERISRSRTASNWTAPQTMAFVFNALRGHALKWFDSLKRSGIDRDNWDTFQTAFLKAFSTTRTPRTATVNLADLHQGQSETVVAFYPRVIKAVDDLEALARGNFTLPDPVWPAEFLAVANFMAIGVDIRANAAQALVSHGATAAFNHMALNLFISNLRPSLRDELLKTTPATLYEAFEAASQLEGIQEPSRKPTLSTAAITATRLLQQLLRRSQLIPDRTTTQWTKKLTHSILNLKTSATAASKLAPPPPAMVTTATTATTDPTTAALATAPLKTVPSTKPTGSAATAPRRVTARKNASLAAATTLDWSDLTEPPTTTTTAPLPPRPALIRSIKVTILSYTQQHLQCIMELQLPLIMRIFTKQGEQFSALTLLYRTNNQ